MDTLLFVLITLVCQAPSFASGQNNRFINPPDSSTQSNTKSSALPVYRVGDILDVSWITDVDVVDLIINQKDSPLTQIDRTPNSDSLTKSSYTWVVTVDGSDGGSKFDLTFNNNFNFMLFHHNSTSTIASSGFFNITNSTIDQYGKIISTSSASSSSSVHLTTTSSSILPTSATATAASSAQASTASSHTSTALSETTKVGVGVGVGVGVAGVAGIAGVALWHLCLRKRSGEYKKSKHWWKVYTAKRSISRAAQNEGANPSELDGPLPMYPPKEQLPVSELCAPARPSPRVELE